jgi:hypothetical protein
MPTFANGQVEVEALGLAVDTHEHTAYYVSAAGAKASLKSVWASLITNKGPKTYCRPWEWRAFAAVRPLKQFWAPLPQSAQHHAAFCTAAPGLLLAVDPTAAGLTGYSNAVGQQRQQLLDAQRPKLHADLVAYLNEVTELPLLPAWGAALWQAATAVFSANVGYGLFALDAYGDCLGAWLINDRYPWLETTQRLIQTGQLTW